LPKHTHFLLTTTACQNIHSLSTFYLQPLLVKTHSLSADNHCLLKHTHFLFFTYNHCLPKHTHFLLSTYNHCLPKHTHFLLSTYNHCLPKYTLTFYLLITTTACQNTLTCCLQPLLAKTHSLSADNLCLPNTLTLHSGKC